jgi:hypothetical protein
MYLKYFVVRRLKSYCFVFEEFQGLNLVPETDCRNLFLFAFVSPCWLRYNATADSPAPYS